MMLAWDTETTLIAPGGTGKVRTGSPIPDLVCLSYCDEQHPEGAIIPWDYEDDIFALLSAPDVVHVCHNISFDFAVMARAIPRLVPALRRAIEEGRVLDTRVMYLFRHPDPPSRAITLQYLAKRVLGEDLGKDEVRTSFARARPLTGDQRQYALADAVTTWRVARALQNVPLGAWRATKHAQHHIRCAHMSKMGSPDTVYSQAAAWQAFYLQGLEVDRDVLRAHNIRLEEAKENLARALLSHGLMSAVRVPGEEVTPCVVSDTCSRKWHHDPTPSPLGGVWMVRRWKGEGQRSPGRLKVNDGLVRDAFAAFAADQGLVAPRTASGKVSAGRDDWADYEGALPPALSLYMQYRKIEKYHASFTRPLVEAGARRVMPRYFIPGAATGRWACSRPNMQQVPKDRPGRPGLRDIYRARAGHTLVMADYPTLELYTLCEVMLSLGIKGPLFEALESGEDIHSQTARAIFGVREVSKEQRQQAKAANFGLPGGMGVRRFLATLKLYGVDAGWDGAKRLREEWFGAFPDIDSYLNRFRRDPFDLQPPHLSRAAWLRRLGFRDEWPSRYEVSRAANRGRLYTVALPTGAVVPERNYSQACNLPFQGVGAAVVTVAFNLCCQKDLETVAVVHDSLTVEAPWEDAAEAGRALKEAMEEALRVVCPNTPAASVEVEESEVWK